jgi:hypothetical protein
MNVVSGFCVYLFVAVFSWISFAVAEGIRPDTPEYFKLCEAAKDEMWESIYKEKKVSFMAFVDECSRRILSFDGILFTKEFQKEWERNFRDAQLSWLEQLEKDRVEYYWSESALGGNHHERTTLRYAIAEIDERVAELKERWWLKE